MDYLKEASEEHNADIARAKVWDTLSNLFLDTSWSQDDLEAFAKTIAESPFSLEELGHILFFEVCPVCAPNLFIFPGGEWAGFSSDWLIQNCLKYQRRHIFKTSGNSDRVKFFVHVLGCGPVSEAYFLLYRAQRKRFAPLSKY